MSSFISNIKSAASGAVGDDKTTNLDQSSNTELLSSAKLVAEAAQSAASNQTDQIDKPKVAGAAGDLLDSVKQYGKFDESQGVGQYINQADEYLRQYEKSSGVVDTKTATPLDEASLTATEAPLEEKKAEYINQADEYLHQYEKSSGVDATTTATPLDEAPLEEKKAEYINHADETPLEESSGVAYTKTATPLDEAPLEEKKAKVPLSVEGEEKTEVPLPVEEENVKVPLPVEEKGEKDEFESAVGAGDAIKAAGSYFK